MQEIKTQEEYFERFKVSKKKGRKGNIINNEANIRALQTALDTRKFEIELYWKRATYFWAFIAAMFVAYFAVFNSDNLHIIKGFTIIISVLGYLFSLGWYFVNRGSKYWQKNWEEHVDLLGKKVQGELFTTIKKSNQNFTSFTKEYPFSVSKVNQILSLVMLVSWLFLIMFSVFFSFDKLYYFDKIDIGCFVLILIIVVIVIVIITYSFFCNSKSFIMDHKLKDSNTIFFGKDK